MARGSSIDKSLARVIVGDSLGLVKLNEDLKWNKNGIKICSQKTEQTKISIDLPAHM